METLHLFSETGRRLVHHRLLLPLYARSMPPALAQTMSQQVWLHMPELKQPEPHLYGSGQRIGRVDQAAAGLRPAAVASSRMPGSMCCSAIEEMPNRMKRDGFSVRSKKRSPGSMMTLREAAASAKPRESVPRGPSSQSDV